MLNDFIQLLTESLKQDTEVQGFLKQARDKASTAHNIVRMTWHSDDSPTRGIGGEINELQSRLGQLIGEALSLNEQISEKTAAYILIARS